MTRRQKGRSPKSSDGSTETEKGADSSFSAIIHYNPRLFQDLQVTGADDAGDKPRALRRYDWDRSDLVIRVTDDDGDDDDDFLNNLVSWSDNDPNDQRCRVVNLSDDLQSRQVRRAIDVITNTSHIQHLMLCCNGLATSDVEPLENLFRNCRIISFIRVAVFP